MSLVEAALPTQLQNDKSILCLNFKVLPDFIDIYIFGLEAQIDSLVCVALNKSKHSIITIFLEDLSLETKVLKYINNIARVNNIAPPRVVSKIKKSSSFVGVNISKLKSIKVKNFKIENIKFDDQKVFELLSSGKTVGLFQVESAGMREALIQMKPNHIEDIIALVALYRPGPIQSGMVDDFIDRKNGANVEYLHPLIEDVLRPTYGSQSW